MLNTCYTLTSTLEYWWELQLVIRKFGKTFLNAQNGLYIRKLKVVILKNAQSQLYMYTTDQNLLYVGGL